MGALALVGIAAVHLYLYTAESYHAIPTIGPLFLLTVVVSVLMAAAVLALRRPVVDLAAAGFALSVLGGYILALLLPKGIFLFEEPGVYYSGSLAIASEVVCAASLTMAALAALRARLRPAVR